MAFAGDAANFILNGIPGDVHDLFVVDVEPGDLARASTAMTGLGDTVSTVRARLSDSVALLEGRWEGDGASAFQTDMWAPLRDGLGVLERESHHAAGQLAQLAAQAEQAHLYKVAAINQEIQHQLDITAISWLVASPELGAAISKVVGGLASRLGGDLVSHIVSQIVQTIEQLIEKVVDSFAQLFRKAVGLIPESALGMLDKLGDSVRTIFGDGVAPGEQVGAVRSAPRLLNAESAVIPNSKLFDYALNPAHPKGGPKARVFKSALGYDQTNAQGLIDQLKKGVRENPAVPGLQDAFGARFTVDIPVTVQTGGPRSFALPGYILRDRISHK